MTPSPPLDEPEPDAAVPLPPPQPVPLHESVVFLARFLGTPVQVERVRDGLAAHDIGHGSDIGLETLQGLLRHAGLAASPLPAGQRRRPTELPALLIGEGGRTVVALTLKDGRFECHLPGIVSMITVEIRPQRVEHDTFAHGATALRDQHFQHAQRPLRRFAWRAGMCPVYEQFKCAQGTDNDSSRARFAERARRVVRVATCHARRVSSIASDSFDARCAKCMLQRSPRVD